MTDDRWAGEQTNIKPTWLMPPRSHHTVQYTLANNDHLILTSATVPRLLYSLTISNPTEMTVDREPSNVSRTHTLRTICFTPGARRAHNSYRFSIRDDAPRFVFVRLCWALVARNSTYTHKSHIHILLCVVWMSVCVCVAGRKWYDGGFRYVMSDFVSRLEVIKEAKIDFDYYNWCQTDILARSAHMGIWINNILFT